MPQYRTTRRWRGLFERYLEVGGPAAIVSGAGVLEAMPFHPWRGPDSLRELGPLLTGLGDHVETGLMAGCGGGGGKFAELKLRADSS